MLGYNHWNRKLTMWMILSLALMSLLMGFAFAAGEKFVDVKPGSCPNAVNFNSRGVLPVALLSGNGEYDVAKVDPSTILFGPAGMRTVAPLRWSKEDVNADGINDLVMHFSVPLLKPLFELIIVNDDDGYVAAGIEFMSDGNKFIYEGDNDKAGLWLMIPGFKQ